jgi:hypothetical protein
MPGALYIVRCERVTALCNALLSVANDNEI